MKMRVNDLSYQIYEELVPNTLFGDKDLLTGEDLEYRTLELVKMKLTDRLIKMNYDTDRFFELINPLHKE